MLFPILIKQNDLDDGMTDNDWVFVDRINDIIRFIQKQEDGKAPPAGHKINELSLERIRESLIHMPLSASVEDTELSVQLWKTAALIKKLIVRNSKKSEQCRE